MKSLPDAVKIGLVLSMLVIGGVIGFLILGVLGMLIGGVIAEEGGRRLMWGRSTTRAVVGVVVSSDRRRVAVR